MRAHEKTAIRGDRGFLVFCGEGVLYGHFHTRFELAALGLAHAAAAFFAGFFVVADALHVLDEAFLLTEFLEAAEHLLSRLVAA